MPDLGVEVLAGYTDVSTTLCVWLSEPEVELILPDVVLLRVSCAINRRPSEVNTSFFTPLATT